MRFPEPLHAGDIVTVFAGSSPFDATLVWRGLAWLKQHYNVRFDRAMFCKQGYLAGSDERRLRELQTAFTDSTVKAVLVARGGYGLSRFAHQLDWNEFANKPKWIVGFSDTTVLHVEAAHVGIASIHGPNVAALGRNDQWTHERWVRVLSSPQQPQTFRHLQGWYPGRASGPLLGGNLTLLHSCAAAGRLHIPKGAIVLLEDVTEQPYRIDRMLTTLMVGGYFNQIAGILLGDWVDCHPGQHQVSVEEVLRERLGKLGVPVVAGAPIGHGRYNGPVVLGATWHLDAEQGIAYS